MRKQSYRMVSGKFLDKISQLRYLNAHIMETLSVSRKYKTTLTRNLVNLPVVSTF